MPLLSVDQRTAHLINALNPLLLLHRLFLSGGGGWRLQVAAEVPRSVYGPAREPGLATTAPAISYFSPESIDSRPRKALSLLSLCIGQIGELSILICGVAHNFFQVWALELTGLFR